jgi:hypothetical protein
MCPLSGRKDVGNTRSIRIFINVTSPTLLAGLMTQVSRLQQHYFEANMFAVQLLAHLSMDVGHIVAEMRKKSKKAGRDQEDTSFNISPRIQLELGSTKGMFIVTTKSCREDISTSVVEYERGPYWRQEFVTTES